MVTDLGILITSFLFIPYYSSEKDLVYLNYSDSVHSNKYKQFYQCNKIKKKIDLLLQIPSKAFTGIKNAHVLFPKPPFLLREFTIVFKQFCKDLNESAYTSHRQIRSIIFQEKIVGCMSYYYSKKDKFAYINSGITMIRIFLFIFVEWKEIPWYPKIWNL